jgi:hypothetical protein
LARKRRRNLVLPQDDTIQLKVRMPESLGRRLAREARDKGLSMNSEIVQRLRWSFSRDSDQLDTIARALLENLEPDVVRRMVEIDASTDALYADLYADRGDDDPGSDK